jgi:hypothetical protein
VTLPKKNIIAGDTGNPGYNLQFGDNSTFQSLSTPASNQATYNCAFGHQTLLSINTGYNNCAFGTFALQNLTTSNSNTAVGSYAFATLTAGLGSGMNVAIGYQAGQALNSNSNTLIGYNAGLGITRW